MIDKRKIFRYQEAFIRLFYPESCGVCGTFLELEESVLCSFCNRQLVELQRAPEDAFVSERTECLDEVWTLFSYESVVRDILSSVKFRGRRRLLQAFQQALSPLLESLQTETHYDGLIPIPISRSKLFSREFNQSLIIADLISKHIQVPVITGVLRKKYQAPSQSLLNREERLANAFGTLTAKGSRHIKGKRFLVVDDIFTTGATGEEAARALKEQGAKRVDLIALARTEIKEEHKK